MEKLKRIADEIGLPAVDRPYYPFPLAMERGLIETERAASLGVGKNPPGTDICNGILPNVRGAGLLSLGNDGLVGAFDHTLIHFEGDDLVISPTSKNDVNKDGRFAEEGAIIFTSERGQVKFAAFVIDVARHVQKLNAFRREGFFFMSRVGHLAIVQAAMMSLPEFEVTEVDTATSQLRARPRYTYQ